AIDDGRQISVRRWRKDLERFRRVRDSTIRTNHKERTIIQLVLGIVRAVETSHISARVAREDYREVLIPRPGRERGVGIDADPDDSDVAAVVEERGVLITVRLHLDRSALGPRLEKKREDNSASAIIREPDWRFEQAVAVGAGQTEIGRQVVDRGASR